MRCAMQSRPPRCRPSRAWWRSTPMATWRTALSACSRSSRTPAERRTTFRRSIIISTWRRRPDPFRRSKSVTLSDLLLEQTINGLSLGAMYALLALGFTLVYGILELINFSHFNVFMVGSFIAMWVLQLFGLAGQDIILT